MSGRFLGLMTVGLLFLVALAMAWEVFVHFTPGAMSPDSFRILEQARSGVLEDGHPPLFAMIWGVIDQVVPGGVGVLLLNLFLFYGGLFLIFVWACRRFGLFVLPAIFIVGLYPPITAILGAIWLDISMAAFFMSAMGVFLSFIESSRRPYVISGSLAAFGLVFLGVSVRHNGAAAAFPLVALFVYLFIYNGVSRISRLIFAVISGGLITLLLFAASNQFSNSVTDVKVNLWRVGPIYDIAGVSVRENKCLYYSDVISGCDLNNISKLYSRRSYIPLLLGEQVHALSSDSEYKGSPIALMESNEDLDRRLFVNWIDIAVRHPMAYFSHRLDFFETLITRSPWGLWTTVFDMVYPNSLGIQERSVTDSRYFGFVRGVSQQGLIFLPITYLAITIVLIIPVFFIGFAYGNKVLIVSSSLYFSGLAHMVGLFFFAVSADSRYSHWMIICVVLASVLVLLEFSRAAIHLCFSRFLFKALCSSKFFSSCQLFGSFLVK